MTQTAQPPRNLIGMRMGACACAVCGWRAWKAAAMCSGWDSFEQGAVTICRWCRARLGVNARELAQLGAGTWQRPTAGDVWTDSLVRHHRTHRWARVVRFPSPTRVLYQYEGSAKRRGSTNAAFLRSFELLAGSVRMFGR